MISRKIQRRDFLKHASMLTAATAAFSLDDAALSAQSQAGRQAAAPARGAAKPQFSLAHLTVLGCRPPR